MTRVFLDDDAISGDSATLRGPDAHHLLNVLRMTPGDTFVVVDERGAERDAVISSIEGDALSAALSPPRRSESEPDVSITLYHGLPRAARYELSLRMCTEVGVSGFVPVLSARSVVRLGADAARRKRDRWQRIVEEAAKQCGRTSIPEVATPVTWSEALARFAAGGTRGIMPSAGMAGGDAPSLGECAADLGAEGIDSLALFIGPESGFDLAEEAQSRDAGVMLVSMGPRILRTETAAVVAAAICLDRFDGTSADDRC